MNRLHLSASEAPVCEPLDRERVTTALGLGVLATVNFYLQRRSVLAPLPDSLEEVTSSLSHPALGYAGAIAAGVVAKLRRTTLGLPAALASASAVNFMTEHLQDGIVGQHDNVPFFFPLRLPETAKDYGFALGGAVLYLWQSKRAHR